MSIRKSCVICSNKNFELINSFFNFPIMSISNNSVKEDFYDYTLISCTNCNCLQLKNLVDPSILYSDVYMISTFTPSWFEHHVDFSKFILSNTNEKSFLEIGANKGDLYKIMSKERLITFTVLDMYKHQDLPLEIFFIEGNCEDYNFKGYNTLILSHVFEHLYNPKKFIENIRNANVENIFISIPNFDLLLKEENYTIIYSQHTFYCGFDYITYLFSLYNYKCEKYFIYDGNIKSSMFKFILDYKTTQIKLPSTDIKLYNNIYIDKIDYLNKIIIPENSYIAPSGIHGQYLYKFINLNMKKNIVGFLDNNEKRHNNNLYGTDKKVYFPLYINLTNSTIIICNCQFKDEIVKGLQNICDSITFLYV